MKKATFFEYSGYLVCTVAFLYEVFERGLDWKFFLVYSACVAGNKTAYKIFSIIKEK